MPFLKAKVDPDRIDAEERIPQSDRRPGQARRAGHDRSRGIRRRRDSATPPIAACWSTSAGTAPRPPCWSARISRSASRRWSHGHRAAEARSSSRPWQRREARGVLPERAGGRLRCRQRADARPRLSDDGTHWILNGDKKYATNAALAGMMTVMARTPVDGERQDQGEGDGVHRHARPARLRDRQPQPQQVGIRGSWQAHAPLQRHARARTTASSGSSARD